MYNCSSIKPLQKGTKQTTITSAAPETARKKTLSFTNKETKVFKKYPEGKKKDQDNSLLQFGEEEFKSFASKTVQSSVVTKSPSRKPRKKGRASKDKVHILCILYLCYFLHIF